MIQLLAAKYQKHIAYSFLLLFYTASVLPAQGRTAKADYAHMNYHSSSSFIPAISTVNSISSEKKSIPPVKAAGMMEKKNGQPENTDQADKEFIGGPSQPEMSRFKSVGVDNMVNLFTGNFSYNIPLMDVGGYPINIFYDGGISAEQDASWVGLGWNINPGAINRNMRGIPDDFDGTDILTTTQAMKDNITWGGRVGADFEYVGIKKLPFGLGSVGGSVGVSVNNYLGPSLELGIKGGTSFHIASLAGPEKSAIGANENLSIGVGANLNINSRGGLTLAPNVSLAASKAVSDQSILTGSLGMSTSYNSRSGISNLNLNGQLKFSEYKVLAYSNHKPAVLGDDPGSLSIGVLSSSISFAKPSYIPAIRMPITNESYSGHFQLGGALYGFYTSGEVEVYKHTSTIEDKDRVQKKRMVGYLYYQKANNNADAVVDFTRFNDKEVTPNTPVVSAPQYTYDVFSINGEGTGGSIRLYRNDYGYVRDNYTRSHDKNISAGFDLGPIGHYGANVNIIKTPSTIGEWNEGNKLRTAIPFKESSGLNESVYFRNPGETSVLENDQFDKIGGEDLVRFKIGGTPMNPTVEPVLERFNTDRSRGTDINVVTQSSSSMRKKRSQVASYLTAAEAAQVGLNREIKIYNSDQPLNSSDNSLQYHKINRTGDGLRLPHHISQINVTEGNGTRYIYDVPVYNVLQKDLTFTVSTAAPDADLVTVNTNETDKNSDWLLKSSKKNGYLQVNETPPYAHSFLLGSLLSPDYVDVKNDGVTEDDLGTAAKFNYTRIENPDHTPVLSKWRTPNSAQGNAANFSAGNRTDDKDDKGHISYGERESWYVHSIESKTMIAIFTLEDRLDAKGPTNQLGGRNNSDHSAKRLKKIDLYSKADLKKNGLEGSNPARPIKSVYFKYSYRLCKNSPDNSGDQDLEWVGGVYVDRNANKGRLTLERIYFTFNGQNRTNKSQYVFAYENSSADNPQWSINSSDRWGNYKPKTLNPGSLSNAVYPYSKQPVTPAELETVNQNAGAWNLKKILLPSGGQIEVDYESDEYAFVQDKRAAVMMNIAGFGKTNTSFTNSLYSIGTIINEHLYVCINVPKECNSPKEVYFNYLKGQEQLAFRLAVQMPKGTEYLTSYGEIDYNGGIGNYNAYCGIYGVPGDKKIWVKLKKVGDNLSPLSVTALEYLKEQLPGQAFPSYDVSDGTAIEQLGGMLEGLQYGLVSAFKDPINTLMTAGKAKYTDLSKCFVRLNEPTGHKYGGGYRVRKIVMKDNWNALAGQYLSQYGSEYNYTTTETYNDTTREISSGVASYEPSIGGEENPFATMIQVADRLPLGPTSFGAVEMPVLDAFFPTPVVGYSKVTVTSLRKGALPQGMKSRSGVGRQVNEFYTAKDYPVRHQYTSLDPSSNISVQQHSFGAFFWKWSVDIKTVSQGFLVAVNDMHGKMKSQASYAENDPTLRINYTENFYRNTGAKAMADEKFLFVNGKDGKIELGNMGIDIEFLTDTRQFSVKGTSQEIQGQLDYFPTPILGLSWLPFVWPVRTKSEDTYRAVTCTKYISYHSVVDRVVVIDKGSQVETRNLVYDGETGGVIVNQTNNEFNDPIYSTTYPAYWGYPGMGPSYKNIDAVYKGIDFVDGRVTMDKTTFESGDELYIIEQGLLNECDEKIAYGPTKLVWAFDLNKNSWTDPASSNTVATPDFIFLDAKGRPFTGRGVSFRIVRSGKRNMLNATAQSAISMLSPIDGGYLKLDANKRVVNTSAVVFKEKWQTDNNILPRVAMVMNNCVEEEQITCEGDLEKSINPYLKGLVGNFKPDHSMVFYADRTEINPTASTNIRFNGYLSNYVNFWNFQNANPTEKKFTYANADTRWVWNTQSTRFNAKSQELETKNALGIYTAAQYGFDRTLPLAVTSNSRYDEMMNESFEDNLYEGSINNVIGTCAKKHVDFLDFLNAMIKPADEYNINAHTGKYLLAVNQNATATKTFKVKSSIPTQYSFQYEQDITKSLSMPGVDIKDFVFNAPPGAYQILNSINNGGFRILTLIGHNHPNATTYSNSFSFNTTHFFEISSTGFHTLKISVANDVVVNDQQTATAYVSVYDMNDNLIKQFPFQDIGSAQDNICLKAGIYKVVTSMMSMYSSNIPPSGGASSSIDFKFIVEGLPSTAYKSITTANGCAFTKPAPATEDMMNPLFSIPAEKKMVLSTWVKEQCGNVSTGVPCNQTSYTNNKVILEFAPGSQSVDLYPSGPIIEGWQRYEGSFTAPNGSNQMTMKLVNSSSNKIFFDDFRIHPFNANMQTYVYDPVTLRLTSQLDANNYASFFEYDEEGGLIRTKVETKEGVKTITETRSAKQKTISEIQ